MTRNIPCLFDTKFFTRQEKYEIIVRKENLEEPVGKKNDAKVLYSRRNFL